MEFIIIISSIMIIVSIIILVYCLIKINIERNKVKVDIKSYYKDISEWGNKYIPFSQFEYIFNKYADLYKSSILLINLGKFKKNYRKLYDYWNNSNNLYVSKEIRNKQQYLDNLFDYKLDDDQKKVIVIDDDYNLVIAGAGSGKTSTMVAKTDYLVECKHIDPKEILVITFTNNAVKNFKDKLSYNDIDCMTFHKLGLSILSDKEKPTINDNLLDVTINKYLNQYIFNDFETVLSMVTLFSYYLYAFREDRKFGDNLDEETGFDFETIKSKYLSYSKNSSLVTLNQEIVKSNQELVIANYLFLHGINYEYEHPYEFNLADKEHGQYKPDFYLIDYDIYLEHFGIDEHNRCHQYDEIEEKKYIDEIKYKRDIHKKYNTKLIETYSYYFNKHTILDKLDKKLKEYGVENNSVDIKEIYKAIICNNNSNELISFRQLINKFINLFKGDNFNESKFDDFIKESIEEHDQRSIILLKIIKEIYIRYEEELNNKKQIDFNDMINLAINKVKDNGYMKKLSYIIVDEFQDVSLTRFLLLKSIINKTGAKLIAVGDDYQSIFRFSGCDLNLFVNFKEYVKHPKILFINNTHRNSQELINTAGSFIMKNEIGQIKKNLRSDLHLEHPLVLFYYSTSTSEVLNKMIDKLKSEKCKSIAILGRNKNDIYSLFDTDINIKADSHVDLSSIFKYNVQFYTVHASKGLEFDGVIVCNLRNSLTGFPNKMADDNVLRFVSLSHDNYLYEEERRLFYVALTRTRNKCLLLVPSYNQSTFIDELLTIDNNMVIDTSNADEVVHNPYCPICKKGRLVVRQGKLNSHPFIACTNYPRCTYKSNYLDIMKNQIKCPRCGNYMVKRTCKYGDFYGCTNYPYCSQTAQIEDMDKNKDK